MIARTETWKVGNCPRHGADRRQSSVWLSYELGYWQAQSARKGLWLALSVSLIHRRAPCVFASNRWRVSGDNPQRCRLLLKGFAQTDHVLAARGVSASRVLVAPISVGAIADPAPDRCGVDGVDFAVTLVFQLEAHDLPAKVSALAVGAHHGHRSGRAGTNRPLDTGQNCRTRVGRFNRGAQQNSAELSLLFRWLRANVGIF